MPDTTITTTGSFKAGETYTCGTAWDSTRTLTFAVVKRTAKFVTLTDKHGETYRVGIKTRNDGTEFVLPLGSFSMAPVLSA